MKTSGKILEEMDRVFGDGLDCSDVESIRTIEISLVAQNDAEQMPGNETLAKEDQSVT